ncbi:MAG: hypothetical protein QXH67_00745 [Candidatus Bathyarchaeia archaeon]|nr:hypothetical protein [Candidatus Bathyarchaeota archaeon]
MVEEKKERSILRFFAEYDRRIIYLFIFIVVIGPLLSPFILPIAVSPDTLNYYKVLDKLGPDDIVMFVLDTEFSGYMEIQSGILASMRVMIERGAKIAIVVSHPEATGIPELIFNQLADVIARKQYTYGKDYVYLGYIFPNEASVAATAQDFHASVRQDYYGKPIAGTFLDRIKDWSSWSLISVYTTGIQSGSLINHYGLRGAPMIVNCIGVMVATQQPYVSSGIYKALLQSMRGGAELEYLIGAPGPGLTAMNSFTLGHYLLIIFIIIGNIGYFGYIRPRRKGSAGG